MEDREKLQGDLEHLNAVLRAVRDVNQLITREKDQGRLLQSACEILADRKGYYSAWAALVGEDGACTGTFEAGLRDDFPALREMLELGERPYCVEKALAEPGLVIVEDVADTCGDCPLVGTYAGRAAVAARLEHAGRLYGLLSVSIPEAMSASDQEQALFQEVANDIAFALHAIEVEEERKRAEAALKERVKELNCLYGISKIVEMPDASLDDILQGAVDLIPPSWQYPEVTCARLVLHQQVFTTHDFDETVWKLASDIIAKGVSVGSLEVFHLDERPEADEGPFLKEERLLIDAVAERLGRIVERKQADEELRRAHEQLVRSERLAVLGQLAGGVGHELRNPLGVMSNSAYFLNMTLTDADEKVKKHLGIIQAQIDVADHIIGDLLDFARAKEAERSATDVNALINQAIEDSEVPDGIEVITQLADDLPTLMADGRQLTQVFGNLISNALDAMPEGGTLKVGTAVDGNRLVITFEDTGCGMAVKELAQIFEPLFTTKARGIGLGLAVSRRLAKLNGGRITAESEVGKGSRFTVEFPLQGGEEGTDNA